MGIRDAWRVLFQRDNASNSRPMRGEIGYTGNKIFSGLPMDEYNSDLAFPKSVEVYDQMRRSDGQIAAVLMAMKLPIRSTKWYVESDENADDEALAEQIAEMVEDNLMGGMKYSWDDHLREALLMLDFGFSVFEKVYKFDTWQGRPVILFDKFAPRVAPSIWRFPQDEKTGDIVAVEQLNYYTGHLYSMPLEKCRIYTYNREGDNPVGMSVLRPAYKHWFYKDALYQIMAVGVEKSLVGTPYAKMPKGASDDDRKTVLQVLSNIRTAQEAGMTIPDTVVLDMLEGKKSAVDAMPLLEHHDTLIARSVLAQFLNLGTMSTASGGAYALGREMVDMFVMGLESVANYIQGEVQKDIEQLVEWNFGTDAPIPKLKHKDITFRDMVQAATALAALGSGHLIMPDEGVENFLREMFGIPPIPQEALTNQRYLPPNRYVPDIVPDRQFTPKEMAAIQQQQAAGGQKASMSEPVFAFADDGGNTPTGDKPRTQQDWKRDLTEFESADALRRLNNQWQKLEQQWQSRLSAQQKTAAQALVEQVRQVVATRMNKLNQMNAVNGIQVPASLQHEYQQQVEQLLTQAYQTGADSTAKELGSTSPGVLDAEAAAIIQAKAKLVAGTQLADLADKVKYAVIAQLSRNVAENEIVSAARQTAAAHVDGGDLKVSGMISVGEALNIGRGSTAKAVGVQGAQWSSVLDSHTCPLCESLDGKVISSDNEDFDVFRPPLHIGCRCFLVYVGTGQTNVEFDWKTPDVALVQKYGKLVN